MKKEVLLAIIIGFGIGLIVTYGIYTAQTAIKNRTQDSQKVDSIIETKENQEGHNVHIVSPESETLSQEEKIIISGTTTPSSYVVILTTNEEYITQADQTGNFASEITLESGANYVGVTSISPEGIKATSQIIITYTTASLTKDQESTQSAKEEPNE